MTGMSPKNTPWSKPTIVSYTIDGLLFLKGLFNVNSYDPINPDYVKYFVWAAIQTIIFNGINNSFMQGHIILVR